MRKGLLDHIDLRVKDMAVAANFYAKFLPQLGFVCEKYEPSPNPVAGEDFCTFYSAGGDTPSEFFGFTLDKNHRANGTRIAFWADTRQKVDEIAELVRAAGGTNLEGRSEEHTSELQSH